MGKANKQKKELSEVVEMVYLIQTLKDIADNKYFTLMNEKDTYKRFVESFSEFFRLLNLTQSEHPMIKNNNQTVGLVVVTIEGSFLSGFNNKIIRLALDEKEKHEDFKFIAIGEKAQDRLKGFGDKVVPFSRMDEVGLYETAVGVKEYLIEEIMNGRMGKVMVFYSWPKSFEIQKIRAAKVLPCDELLTKHDENVKIVENVIKESEPDEIMGYLSNLWLTNRLYEIFVDTTISSAAAQASLLEESVNRMKKEKAKSALRYSKAKKMDIDKGLRETFSARMMVTK